MKITRILLIIVLLIIAFLLYRAGEQKPNDADRVDNNGELVDSQSEAQLFTGTLTEFNPGCYVDGECYAIVDGKHVTIARGWSQETVGSVTGTDSGMGGLESHIGGEVEVYAQYLDENTYTLYGSEDYYIDIK